MNKSSGEKHQQAILMVISVGDHLYLVKRQNKLSVFPGYHSFPGGKVDPEDHQTEVQAFQEVPFLKNFPASLMACLLREAKEEIQWDMLKAIENGEVLSLSEVGVALTPTFNPYRFETHFYLIELKEKIDFQFVPYEVAWASWPSATEALNLYHQGDLLVVPPLVNLLKHWREVKQKQKIQLNLIYDESREVPCIESIYGVRQLPVLSHTLPPFTRTNAFLIGDHQKYLIDPSPYSLEEMEKLCQTIGPQSLHGIFLTHSHPDHYEYAPMMARRFAVPLKLGRDTFERISLREGNSYWDQVKVEFVQEGDVLTHWLGSPVQIYAVPGHDEGQLALAPQNLKWFLAGDLFQGNGTVVIAAPEGNMTKYLHTLQKVINLKPNVLFPSHGLGLGGTWILEKIIQHRLMRENQILSLYQQGLSLSGMVEKLYGGMSELLQKLGERNIEAHLQKLKEEGRIPSSFNN